MCSYIQNATQYMSISFRFVQLILNQLILLLNFISGSAVTVQLHVRPRTEFRQ